MRISTRRAAPTHPPYKHPRSHLHPPTLHTQRLREVESLEDEYKENSPYAQKKAGVTDPLI